MKLWKEPIILASTSPRRKELLASIVQNFSVTAPKIDDGVFGRGTMSPRQWVQTLAVLKAQNVQQQRVSKTGCILGADTVCVLGERIYGQPQSSDEARAMIVSMMGKNHEVLTGWCIINADGSAMQSGVEESIVRVGDFSGKLFESHLETGAWRGKAGGYNYLECARLGWPLECRGEIDTVIGLPTKKIQQLLVEEI